MKSPFGQRSEICAKYGWTWQYLHEMIPWRTVMRMMADSAWYENEGKTETVADVFDCENLTAEQIEMLKNL